MSQVLTVARKELRAYFLSPVALIFLATFLFVVLFAFFWQAPFFRRNIADVRPLFEWLPVLLIFLVSALTMRLWSEEQRMGTLEILFTLPVKIHRLVLGKFVAGLVLVSIALGLTLSLPVTVSMLGDLDWGPVIGGYVGALLLAAAYLAVGLCISSSTANPLVALLLTGLCCGLLYLLGSETLTAFSGNRWGEILRGLGTGSRFASIERGVLDLRDIIYYLSLCVGFLFLNTALLTAKKWSDGASTQSNRSATKLSVALVVCNLLLLNVVAAPVRAARVDMTERKEYSVSAVTEKLLKGLDAPLIIRGYFSARTHPKLAPLVPQIRDLIEEYGVIGGDRVTAEFIDPRRDPAAEKEANEDYGIKSVPFQFADRHEASVVNSYFNVLIKYGDKYEKLGFEELIEVNVTGLESVEVKLRNLEYDLTRMIKKVVFGFQPLEEVFARASAKVTLTAYVTKGALPDNVKELPNHVRKVAEEISKRAGGKFSFSEVDPGGEDKEALRKKLYEQYGIKPLGIPLLSGEMFYLHLVLASGDRHTQLLPAPEMSEAQIREEISAGLKRLVPGFLKTAGLRIAPVKQAGGGQFNPMMNRGRPQQGPQYELLRSRLSENYTVKNVDLKKGRVGGDIDVLILAGPEDLDEKERFAVDQYLMRGGAVVVCAGRYALDTGSAGAGGLRVKKVDSKLSDLLATWGVKVDETLVLDPQNEAFPVPVERDVAGLTLREIQLVQYPFWVDIRGDGMADGSPVVAGLPSVTLQWSSPLTVNEKKGVAYTKLLTSSGRSWVQSGDNIQPDFDRWPRDGFGRDDKNKQGRRLLALTAGGVFTSWFKGKRSPLLPKGTNSSKGDSAGVIEQSPKNARLVVVGSGNFIRDSVLNISRQTGSDRYLNNLQFIQNVVDWAVADVDLLSIRSRGRYARTLRPVAESDRFIWEGANYGFVVLALAGIVILAFFRRNRVEPIKIADKDSAD